MEAGGSYASQQELGKQNYIGSTSEVFDVVIDPLTDFRILEASSEPSSPQQSFRLPTSLCSLHSPSEDATLSSSNISLSSGSDTSCVKNRAVSSVGGGASSNHHRLVIPEVHRFGYNPPCAASPHDLASCPVSSISASQTVSQTGGLKIGNQSELYDKYDTLKALNQASSALALTETLIGPLRIPPVSQEVLDKVVSKMEKNRIPSLIFNHNGSASERQQITSVQSHTKHVSPSVVSNTPPVVVQAKPSINIMMSDVADGGFSPRRQLGSQSSILEPDIHKLPRANGFVPEHHAIPYDQGSTEHRAEVDKVIHQKDFEAKVGEIAPPDCGMNTSRMIAVPVGMSDNGPVEVFKEVHPYPASSITTVVERCSYIGQTEVSGHPHSGVKKRKKRSQKLKYKKDNEHYISQNSLASGSSACSSVASNCTIVSNNSSELTPITQSLASSSRLSLSESRSDCGGPVSKPILSAAIMQMRQALESVSTSDNRSDKSSGGALEVASNFSDTSSNLSTLSDLSGYEDEYIRIKRLVSDAVIPPEDYKKLLDKTNAKSHASKPVPSVDYEKIIRDLQAQKEDLEIQLHRLSIQVQNAVREKELYQQQLELMNTKITETNQKQYFEVLKQRANLEGQLEMLKQELENSVYEKNQVQAKVSDALKDTELSKADAAKAKEAESLMGARLLKYEDANKELEDKLQISSRELNRMNAEQTKAKTEIHLLTERNLTLEQSIEQLQDVESSSVAEIRSLKSRLSSLQVECQSHIQTQHRVEAAASKASSELKAAQTSSIWYQEQLQISQAARTSIQQELVEARAAIAKLSSEKGSLDSKVQTLLREAEDGQARAVREKASLVAHLEALQADMAEREALVSQLERDRGNDTKLMEDRRQRLEQDRQRIHKLRLDLSDTERHLDTLRDDLKHKCILISKYEKELKDLRTLEAVNQEVLGERDARIQNLEQALSESKLQLNNALEDAKQNILVINTLKEDKSNVEVLLTAASNEKKEVDDAIIKVREDMTKLSSNFYRMKHDLAVKDRQVEIHKNEAEDMRVLKESLAKKCVMLETKVNDDVGKKKCEREIESLTKEMKEMSSNRENLLKEMTDIKRNLKTVEIEKKGLSEAVRLREEQIQNMQGSLENYREAILKKDEELYVTHEQNSSLEKSYSELRRTWDSLRDENMAMRQEAEACIDHEKAQNRELSDLKESIQKERKFKQNLEKKMEKTLKEQEEVSLKMEAEKNELIERCKDLSQELLGLKQEKLEISDVIEKFKKDKAITRRELEVLKDEKLHAESKLEEMISDMNDSKQGFTNNVEMVKVLESQMEVLLKENGDLTSRVSSDQHEKCMRVMELENMLQMKGKEIVDTKKVVFEKDTLIIRLEQDKKQASNELSNILAENVELKKKLISNECQSNEGKDTPEQKVLVTQKIERNNENLQKEILVLQTKCSETETKLKEVKESMEITMKSTKKESLLMKAKMKEFEKMKIRCKDLEKSKVSSQELHTFEMKCSEIETKLKSEEEKVMSLEASLTDKEQIIHRLEQKERDLTTQMVSFQDELTNLQLKFTALEETNQKSLEDLNHHQAQLKVVENERDEWMVKYESLRDIIPERDTSTQRAVQLGMSDSQVLNSNQEAIAVPPLDNNSSLNISHTDLGMISNMSQTPMVGGSQFYETMTDLQTRVNLSSQALQSKEKQICELQHQISLLNLNEKSSSNANPQDAFSYSEETIPVQAYRQQIQCLLDRIKQLQTVNDCSISVQTEESVQKETVSEEMKVLQKKLKNLESMVSSKENELEKSQAKVSEFQEKHRRYESNVRLLTRKLKEHMKGRKSAEKEIQLQAEEQQRLMNEEQQRYSILRCRYMEMEGRCESLDGQVGGMETEIEEVRSALNCARQEAQDHHENTLVLQKEIGRLQELSKTAENLRSEIRGSEEILTKKEGRIKELEKEVQQITYRLKENETAYENLKQSLEQHQSEVVHLQQKYNNAETAITDVRYQLKIKEEENVKLSEALKDLEGLKSELGLKLLETEKKCKQVSEEVQSKEEEHFRVASEVDLVKMQLQESITKTNALETHIKVLEGELRVAKEEIHLSKERLASQDSAHQVKVHQMEESINRSRQEVATMATQLNQVQKERVSYQTQATELRMALHSALAQLKTLEAEEEAREAIETEVGIIPSPSPLDLTALTELMEKSVRPVQAEAPLSSLQTCLSSLKAEVATLQTQIQSKGNEISDESCFPEVGSGVEIANPAYKPSRSSSRTEVV